MSTLHLNTSGNNHKQFVTTEAQREIIANVLIGGKAANCAYNESVSLIINGAFNVTACETALMQLVERHDSLRTRFDEDGSNQIVDNIRDIDFIYLDLTAFDQVNKDEKIAEIINKEVEHAFDLFTGPLCRFRLLKLSADAYQLILTYHHVICDGWSMGVLLQDLSKLYNTIVTDSNIELVIAEPFEKYVEEELVFIASDEYKATETFWLNQFKNNLPFFEVPADYPRPSKRTYRAERVDIAAPESLIEDLRKYAAAAKVSYVTLLTAAFEVFLSRITGLSDIVVGLPAAGQSATGRYQVTGHCVNLLPLRTNVDIQNTFADYLKKRKSSLLDAFEHQRLTFGSLVRKLAIPRDPGRIPLVPVAFNLDIGLTDGVQFADCEFRFVTNPRHYENFEIFINASGAGNVLTFECTYNIDLFKREYMQLRMEEFIELLKGIADNPETQIKNLPLLTSDETDLIFQQWNPIDVSFPAEISLHEWFDKTANAYPERIAVSWNDTEISYRELNQRSAQLATWIAQQKIAVGSNIAILTERNIDLAVAILGVLKSGCTYVPIDPSYPNERINHMLADASCPLLIVSASLLPDNSGAALTFLIDTEWAQGPGNISEVLPPVHLQPEAIAYIIYTSGSTGKPKGTMVEHRNVTRLFTATEQLYGFNERDVWTLFHSAAFDFSVWEFYGALLYGGKVVIVDYNTSRDPLLFYKLLISQKVTVLNQTPSAFYALMDAESQIQSGDYVNSLRFIIFGGEALDLTALSKWYAHHREDQPVLVNMYGITETTVHVTFRKLSAADAISPEGSMIGKPIHDLQVYILDPWGSQTGIGIAGEMYVGGAGVARGYLNRPELTKEKFLHNEFNPFSDFKLYRTGDLAKFTMSGDISYLGRIDNQVKIRGFRIELGEIEAILDKHEAVKQRAVIVREDQPGDKRIVAYVVLRTGKAVTAAALRNFVKQELPEYMVPAAYVFLEQLPMTGNGKLNRKALPRPEFALSDPNEYEEPYTPVEEMLATIWSDILGIDRIGRNDNFFELGGHSLLGVKMFNMLRDKLGVQVELGALFSAPTIAELGAMIDQTPSDKPWSCLVPIQQGGAKAPLFCIHMHNGNIHRWRVLKKHLGAERPIYAIQPRGLDQKQPPHQTIEEMAGYYVELIREVQPHGPYNLIGLCFSGMVVYEMAVILQGKGEQVAFLGMINNYAPPENPALYKIKSEVNKFFKLDADEKWEYLKEKEQKIRKKIFGENANGKEVQPVRKIGNDLRTIHSYALLNYHPVKTYDGDLFLYRNDEPIEEFFNQFLGWDRLVKGIISTDLVQGSDNDTIITDEPFNAVLSGYIRKHLDQVN